MSTTLEVAAASRILRDAVKDRAYRATPLGLEVAKYYRWKKNEWGAERTTLRDYEAILAKTAVFFADLELADFEPPIGTERLRECWDHYWGERSARTRAKVRSVWSDFFAWAVNEHKLHGNPVTGLARPKHHESKKEIFSKEFVDRVISSQDYLADKLGCILILQYAIRKGGLIGLQMKHFDFERRRVSVTEKGSKHRLLPVVDDSFWRELGQLQLEKQLGPEDYLLYRRHTRIKRVAPARATEFKTFPDGSIRGYAEITWEVHSKGLKEHGAHDWWYRCLAQAGIVPKDVTAGQNMHRGRHTVATDILRRTGNLAAASKLLGHESLDTTMRAYASYDDTDLANLLSGMYSVEDEV